MFLPNTVPLQKPRCSTRTPWRTSLACEHNCIPVPTPTVWHTTLYRVSQEERTKLREGVPCVKLYWYNPKHLCPKLNGFRHNGKWSLKLWQLLHTYWLPNSYWNWQEYVVSVMLISVLNIKVTCEWHKAINLNCKVPRTCVIVIHRVRSTIHHTGMLSGEVTRLVWLPVCNLVYQTLTTTPQRVPWRICRGMHFRRASAELVWRTGKQIQIRLTSWQLSFVDLKEVHNFTWPLSQ